MYLRHDKATIDPLFSWYGILLSRGLIQGGQAARKIAVYTGGGASHSWIWFADLFERLGLYDVSFISENDVLRGDLSDKGAFFIGGGDTLEMAASLGRKGASILSQFVSNGGFYYGSCAGAYLALSGVDREPFAEFDLFHGNMLNVMENPPPPRCLEHKYTAPYGNRSVFNPVYGEVVLKGKRGSLTPPMLRRSEGIPAPLYGGPVIEPYQAENTLATYRLQRKRVAFLWDYDEAANFLEGKSAVCAEKRGKGLVLVSGPHLEHPIYPVASCIIAEMLLLKVGVFGAGVKANDPGYIFEEPSGDKRVNAIRLTLAQRYSSEFHAQPGCQNERDACEVIYSLKGSLSNARIVAFGLEKMPVAWKIGLKVWEPEKIRMFLDSAWKRLPRMSRYLIEQEHLERLDGITEIYSGITKELKSLVSKIEKGLETELEARILLDSLKKVTKEFLSVYFEILKCSDNFDFLN